MIDLEQLQRVETIVSHANCPDGIASALILHDVLPRANVVLVTHGMTEYLELRATPHMLFCDITPPEARIDEFVAHDTIVLDHHKSAKSIVTKFHHHVFADEVADPGVSGAMLAYREVWKPLAFRGEQRPAHHAVEGYMQPVIERFARLASIRDTWQKHDVMWEESCEQAEWLRFYSFAEMIRDGRFFNEIQKREEIGRLLRAKRRQADEETLQRKFEFKHGDLQVLLIPTLETSDLAETVRTQYDLVIGFAYLAINGQPHLRLSLRSGPKFDCQAFCKALGGGGHTRAAGCTIKTSMIDPGPYIFIQKLLAAADVSTRFDTREGVA